MGGEVPRVVALLRVLPSLALALALALPLPALAGENPLEQVRGALAQFAGTLPVTAMLERAVTADRKDRPLESGRVSLTATAGPKGVAVTYPPGLLEQIRAERAQTDPEKPKPVTRTIEGFDAIDIAALLNGANVLLSDLDGATLKGVTEVEYQGEPARLLDLDLVVRTSRANSKWLKSASSVMKLWVRPDGVPLAAEREFSFRAGLLMFTFDGKDVESHAFAVAGDRLVAYKYTTRFDGDGLGESQHNWAETTLKLVKP